MKAIVKAKRERGVEVQDVPYPELKSGWVIIDVKACGICGSDLHTYNWAWSKEMEALFPIPQILGHEFSGDIVEVGRGVEGFTEGDRVTAYPFQEFCGKCYYCRVGKSMGCTSKKLMGEGGAMAEYVTVPAYSLYKLPDNVSYEVGALCEAFAVGLNAAEVANLLPSQAIVILGPGPIGLVSLIASKLYTPALSIITGTAADISPRLELAKKLGADIIINVDKEEPVKRVIELTDGLGADVVFEATGIPLFSQGLNMLGFEGKYIAIGHPVRPVTLSATDYMNMQLKRVKILSSWCYDTKTWIQMMKLLEDGKVNIEPLITHKLPLEEATKGFELAMKKEAVKVVFTP